MNSCKTCGGAVSKTAKYCAFCLKERRQARLDAASDIDEDDDLADDFQIAPLGNLEALLEAPQQLELQQVQEDVADVIEEALEVFEEAAVQAGLFTPPVWLLQTDTPKNVDLSRRILACTQAKRANISIDRLMDVMDGKKAASEDKEVSKLLRKLEPQLAALQEKPKDKARKQYTKKKIRFSHRKVTSLHPEEVLFILIWQEQEREVARKIGEPIAGRFCTEEDRRDKVVIMDVDKEVWLGEVLRIQR